MCINSKLFVPLPPCLHTCYGSCFVNLACHGYSSSSLFRRLVDPVLVSGGGSSRPSGSPRSLLGSRDCGQSREVQFCSVPEGSLSGDSSGLPNFCGFSVPGSNRQAAVSRRRISVLRSTARRLLAVSAGHSVFSHPSGTRWQASNEVSSVPTTPELGSGGGLHSGPLDSRLSPRPPLVVRRASSTERGLSRPGLPGPRLLVRRLGRGLGAHLGPVVVSGLWSPEEVGVSINARELLALEKGLLHFQSSLWGSTVAIYVDNSTAVAHLQSLFLNEIVQRILRWSELHEVTLAQQFISGSRNVIADSLSCPHQTLGSEWTLHRDVFRDLRLRWPVIVDLFATSANHCCSVYFFPFRDPQSAGTGL